MWRHCINTRPKKKARTLKFSSFVVFVQADNAKRVENSKSEILPSDESLSKAVDKSLSAALMPVEDEKD